jgi:hypothetical protein
VSIALRSSALLLASIWLSACDQSKEQVTAPTLRRNNAVGRFPAVVGSKYPRPDEDRFVLIGKEVSSFAGFYFDTLTGALVVSVADSSHFGPAAASIQRHLTEESFGIPPRYRSRRITVKKVAYSFQQLSDWRDLASDSILGKFGTEILDLDEGRNRVTISVPRSRRNELAAALVALGIPTEAVYFRDANRNAGGQW